VSGGVNWRQRVVIIVRSRHVVRRSVDTRRPFFGRRLVLSPQTSGGGHVIGHLPGRSRTVRVVVVGGRLVEAGMVRRRRRRRQKLVDVRVLVVNVAAVVTPAVRRVADGVVRPPARRETRTCRRRVGRIRRRRPVAIALDRHVRVLVVLERSLTAGVQLLPDHHRSTLVSRRSSASTVIKR